MSNRLTQSIRADIKKYNTCRTRSKAKRVLGFEPLPLLTSYSHLPLFFAFASLLSSSLSQLFSSAFRLSFLVLSYCYLSHLLSILPILLSSFALLSRRVVFALFCYRYRSSRIVPRWLHPSSSLHSYLLQLYSP